MCDTNVLPCKYDICYRYDGEYLCLCVAVVCIFVVYVSSEASSERKKSRVGARWSGGNDNQALVLLFRRWAESGAVILLFICHLDMFLSEAPPGGEVCRGEKDNQTFALFFWGWGEVWSSYFVFMCLYLYMCLHTNCICRPNNPQ